jgi:hypothetical protein
MKRHAPLCYFVGLDLGQAADFTAAAVLERPAVQLGEPQPDYALRHLQRFPLGTPYPEVVRGMVELLARPPLCDSRTFLAVDKTGVGAPVCDLLRPQFPGMAVITITGGSEVTAEPGGYRVPKKDLVGVLEVLFQGRRLKIARELPEAAVLVKELQSFRAKVNIHTGNENLEAWRERDHDDLVLAVALAAWLGERAAVEELEALTDVVQFDVFSTR